MLSDSMFEGSEELDKIKEEINWYWNEDKENDYKGMSVKDIYGYSDNEDLMKEMKIINRMIDVLRNRMYEVKMKLDLGVW